VAANRLDFGLSVTEGGVLRLVNQAAVDLVGGTLEKVAGRSVDDFVRPAELVARDQEDFATGRFERVELSRSLVTSGGEQIPVRIATRFVEVGDQRFGVNVFVREDELGQLGRNPSRLWMDLVPVCVGFADRGWRVSAISADVYELLGRLPRDCVGSSVVDWIGADQATALHQAALAEPLVPRMFTQVEVMAEDGASVEVTLLLGPQPPLDQPPIVFALVGTGASYLPAAPDRVSELEMRLRRIGAEVRAAGVLDSFTSMPTPTDIPELEDLTTRQWEILNRIAQGQRVQTIAKALYISPSTVRNHLALIFQKFGVHSQAELIERIRLPGHPSTN